MSASVLGGQSDSESPETIAGQSAGSYLPLAPRAQEMPASAMPASPAMAALGAGSPPAPGGSSLWNAGAAPANGLSLGAGSTQPPAAGAFTPTAEHIKRFEAATKSKFGGVGNKGDMASMQNMIRMGGATPNARTDSMNTFSPAQYAAAQRRKPMGGMIAKRASLTPFACFDSMTKSASPAAAAAKGATGIAGWLSKLLGGGAQKLRASAGKAKGLAYTEGHAAGDKLLRAQGGQAVGPHLAGLEASSGVGNARNSLADVLGGAGKTIADNPNLQKGINIGVPVVGGGAALYGSNRMGHSSGLNEGMSKGYDTGVDYGIQAAQQNAPQDPGILGRIMNVFRGQGEPPSAASLQAMLDQNKSSILARLRQTI